VLRSKLRQADNREATAFVPKACITARKTVKQANAVICLFLILVVVILLVHSSAMPEKVVIRLYLFL